MLGGIFRKSTAFASGSEFRGATSGWSNTQTVTIPANTPLSPTSTSSTSPSQNPTATPNQTDNQTGVLLGLGWGEIVIITLLSVITVLLVIVIVFLRKRSAK